MNKVVTETLEVENLIFNIRRTGDTAGRGVNNLNNSLQRLHRSSQSAHKGLGSLLHTIGRLAKMMVLRQAIRAVIKALSEGLKNAYMFNSMMGGQMSQALDALKSASVQATGAIGSAFGELLANLSPILISILNLVSKVADALAQVFAVLGGRGKYTKAVTSAEKWAKATQSGAKAAKEWKNQLLGFDEINRLEAPSDSGGGSGSPAYGGAFELADANSKWAEQLRTITMDWWNSLNFEPIIQAWDRLKEAVGGFVALVNSGLKWAYENVLLPLAGWTIEEGAPAVVNLLASAFEFLNAVIEKLAPIFDDLWNNYLKPIAQWIGDKFVKVLNFLADGFSGLAEKVRNAQDFADFLNSLNGKEALVLTIVGAIAMLVAVLNPIPTLIALIITAGTLLVKNWDKIKEAAGALIDKISTVLSNINEKVETAIHNVFDPITNFFDSIINKVQETWNFIGGFFSWLGGSSANTNVGGGINGYASGGYPDTGELFLARENGIPEMVGTIGGQTAVATNADIVAAVSTGVAEAVSSVMGSRGSQPVSVKVYLDSREIKAGQQRLARAMGS